MLPASARNRMQLEAELGYQFCNINGCRLKTAHCGMCLLEDSGKRRHRNASSSAAPTHPGRASRAPAPARPAAAEGPGMGSGPTPDESSRKGRSQGFQPSDWTQEQIDLIRSMLAEGKTKTHIAEVLGRPKTTVYMFIKDRLPHLRGPAAQSSRLTPPVVESAPPSRAPFTARGCTASFCSEVAAAEPLNTKCSDAEASEEEEEEEDADEMRAPKRARHQGAGDSAELHASSAGVQHSAGLPGLESVTMTKIEAKVEVKRELVAVAHEAGETLDRLEMERLRNLVADLQAQLRDQVTAGAGAAAPSETLGVQEIWSPLDWSPHMN